MNLTTSEKIKILCKRRGLSLGELAERTNQSRQNLSNKFSRDNFQESELRAIAEVLGCSYDPQFTMLDSGEVI